MKEQMVTDALLREFLLGKVNDAELERIENLFLTDPHTKERVLAIEQELIEDYLEDSLAEADKEKFLSLYTQTHEQRRMLRIAKSINDWAVTEASTSQAATATVSVWSRLRTRLRLNPVFVVPIAVTIVIAIVLAIVWLNSQIKQRKHLAVEQELAQLNTFASLREIPPQMDSLDLSPLAVRSVEQEREFKIRDDIRIVELRLPWVKRERYSKYQAEVRRVDGSESFTIPNLQAEKDGHVIRIRLPTRILRRGQYQIYLSGIANDGSTSPAEEYTFAVSG